MYHQRSVDGSNPKRNGGARNPRHYSPSSPISPLSPTVAAVVTDLLSRFTALSVSPLRGCKSPHLHKLSS
ncbi:unnamed protein product [Microthlaspi erraticum]|uniref:Uncharacterized protein n=1 Tax=Microthlaspi erraticum TaxID=1685480 RepID=A0A6D2K613_9BRAS|nr:unnamed protein product [Microthlaspi erraticum]